MNYWIRRSHKRQHDLLTDYLRSLGADFGLNLYSRSVHSIEVLVGNKSFMLVRTGNTWCVRNAGKTIVLPPLSDPQIWDVLKTIFVGLSYVQFIN